MRDKVLRIVSDCRYPCLDLLELYDTFAPLRDGTNIVGKTDLNRVIKGNSFMARWIVPVSGSVTIKLANLFCAHPNLCMSANCFCIAYTKAGKSVYAFHGASPLRIVTTGSSFPSPSWIR